MSVDSAVTSRTHGPDLTAAKDPMANLGTLTKNAAESDKAIRQWVKTARIDFTQLSESLDKEDLENGTIEARAEVLDALGDLNALEAAGPKPPPLYLLGFGRGRMREQFARLVDQGKFTLARTEKALDKAIQDAIKRQLKERASRSREDLYGTSLPALEYEDLAELDRDRDVITTSSRRLLNRFVDAMPGGSIGIAGPRGAGKSTLIRTTCARSEESITGIIVSAPVDFVARDFILHLFARVCHAVLGSGRVEELRQPDGSGIWRNPDESTQGRRRRQMLISIALLLSGLCAILGAALVAQSVFELSLHLQASLVWGIALLLVGLATGALIWQRPRVSWIDLGPIDETPPGSYSARAVRLAERRLRDIWFQQTFTSGWSGSLALPIGVEGGLEGSRELARQQMSMPEIVAELKALIEAVAEPDPGAKPNSVRIGIDELDKIDSGEKARRFMNEIKVLFGIRNCFFFVSVSEDAMSDFERRGLPFRDVFDSSFDDIVQVGYLEAPAAISLIQGRVYGMPVPFILFGHCMAGGLARDLIRVTRDIAALAPAEGKAAVGLSDICRPLVAEDVRGKAAACAQTCSRLPHTREAERLQAWFRRVRSEAIDETTLLDRCGSAQDELDFLTGEQSGRADAQPGNPEARTPGELASEFLAFCYFAATVLQYFSGDRPHGAFEAAVGKRGRRSDIDQLAQARQAFSVSPRAAWETIEGFRAAQNMIPGHPFPVFAS